jgi:hypothetical protein
MEENMVYLFSIYRYTRREVEMMRPSDFMENCTGSMTLKELESHWNNKKNGGITMDIENYWIRIS